MDNIIIIDGEAIILERVFLGTKQIETLNPKKTRKKLIKQLSKRN